MKHLQLQPRLRLLADMVPAGAHLADIGTDHGYLPVWLMQQGRIASAIAADIGRGALGPRAAHRGGIRRGGSSICACATGLRGIAPHEADTVVMAGMGGETIIRHPGRIAPWPRTSGAHTLLLQPQTKVGAAAPLAFGKRLCLPGRAAGVGQGQAVCGAANGGRGGLHPREEARLYAGFCLENDPLYGDYLDAQLAAAAADDWRACVAAGKTRDCGTLPELIAAAGEEKRRALS